MLPTTRAFRNRLSFAKTSAGFGIAAWYASGAQRLELEDVVPGEVKATLSRRAPR